MTTISTLTIEQIAEAKEVYTDAVRSGNVDVEEMTFNELIFEIEIELGKG